MSGTGLTSAATVSRHGEAISPQDGEDINYDPEHYSHRVRQASQRVKQQTITSMTGSSGAGNHLRYPADSLHNNHFYHQPTAVPNSVANQRGSSQPSISIAEAGIGNRSATSHIANTTDLRKTDQFDHNLFNHRHSAKQSSYPRDNRTHVRPQSAAAGQSNKHPVSLNNYSERLPSGNQPPSTYDTSTSGDMSLSGGGGLKPSLGYVASSAAKAAAAVLTLGTITNGSPINLNRRSIHGSSPSTGFSSPIPSQEDTFNCKSPTPGFKPLRKQRHVLSRSNSSLEEQDRHPPLTVLASQREYGSTSSIDVIGLEEKKAVSDHVVSSTVTSFATSGVVVKTGHVPVTGSVRGIRASARGVQFDLGSNSTPASAAKVKESSSFGFLKRFRKSSGSNTPSSSHHSSFFNSSNSSSIGSATGVPSGSPNHDGESPSGNLVSQHSMASVCPDIPSSSSDPPNSAQCRRCGAGQRVDHTFVHYDVQAALWALPGCSGGGCTKEAKHDLLEQRRSTGASAAATVHNCDTDPGDGNFNTLLHSCPHFRNEIGGDPIRILSTTRLTTSPAYHTHLATLFLPSSTSPPNSLSPPTSSPVHTGHKMASPMTTTGSTPVSPCQPQSRPSSRNHDHHQIKASPVYHYPSSCNAVSLLEPPTMDESVGGYWTSLATSSAGLTLGPGCSVTSSAYFVEFVDHGAAYYRKYFHGYEDHQNWFGMDDTFGPIAVSVRREKVFDDGVGSSPAMGSRSDSMTAEFSSGGGSSSAIGHQWRVIVRTKELSTLRGSILEDLIPCSSRFSSSRGAPVKDVLQFICPELPLSCLRQGLSEAKTHNVLLKLDEQSLSNVYKIGVLLCKYGQSTEEEMYNNEQSSPAFEEFLNLLGDKVTLKHFDKYKGGLDTKTNMTGEHSYYTTHRGAEIMFHVSTLLPYTPNNAQQVLRKRHIGNDMVTIVFQEPGALPFSPRGVRSQFQHVFIVVRVHNPCTDHTSYSLAVTRSIDVPPFGPSLPCPATFPKSKEFIDFILTKAMNGENAAHKSPKFHQMEQRTREEYLKELATSHATNTTLDTKSPKFFLGSGRRKDKQQNRPLRHDLTIQARGALAWPVHFLWPSQESVDASAHSHPGLLALGPEQGVIIDQETRQVVFTLPCRSVIGWTRLHEDGVRLHYNQGEFLTLLQLAEEDINQILQRLDFLSPGCHTMEIWIPRQHLPSLHLNSTSPGSLIITTVDKASYPAVHNVKDNSRLLFIDHQSVLSMDTSPGHLNELLSKPGVLSHSSTSVLLVLIPPDPSGGLRRGIEISDILVTNEACSLFSLVHTRLASTPGSPTSTDDARRRVLLRRESSEARSDPTSSPSSSVLPTRPHTTHFPSNSSPEHRFVPISLNRHHLHTMEKNPSLPTRLSQDKLHTSRSQSPPSYSSLDHADGRTRKTPDLINPLFRENLRKLIDPSYTEDDIRKEHSTTFNSIGSRTFNLPLEPSTSELIRRGRSGSAGAVTLSSSSSHDTQTDWERLVQKANNGLIGSDKPSKNSPVNQSNNPSQPTWQQSQSNSFNNSLSSIRVRELEDQINQLQHELAMMYVKR